MQQKTIRLDIRGMHCRSCEIVLERDLLKVKGISKVRSNFRKGVADINYEGNELNLTDIEKVVEAAGYALGKDDKKSFFSKNSDDYMDLAATASVLFVLYLFVKLFGIWDGSIGSNFSPGLSTALLIGLTAGISSCMALVGGLVLALSARHAEMHPGATASQKFIPHLFFNLGRIISYALLGGLIGWVGSALNLSSGVLGTITIGLGFVMLVMGLKLVDIFPRLNNFGFFLPKSISRFFGVGKEINEYSHKTSFVTGALTFFIPCGFTQAMQLFAISTGSFTQGAAIMFLFALGTAPGLLGIGGLTSVVKGAFSRYFFKFAGLIVLILALFNFKNGLNLVGLDFSLKSDKQDSEQINYRDFSDEKTGRNEVDVKIIDGKQIAEMEQGNGYSPNEFTVKKGVPVKWVINSTNSYTCASSLMVPKLGINQTLSPGENIIEFTPTEAGIIRFTCSMGMFSGAFNVIE